MRTNSSFPILLAVALATWGCGETEMLTPGQCTPGCPANQWCQDGTCLGEALWSSKLPVNVHGDVAISSSGNVVVTAAEPVENLYRPIVLAFSPDGERLWERQVGRVGPFGFPSRPVLDVEDNVYVTINRSLYALEPDGYLKWTLDTPGSATGEPMVNSVDPPPSPSIGPDGTVYWQFIAATSGKGELQWRQYVDPYTPCETSLPVRHDRVLIRGGLQMFALDDQGEVAWNVEKPFGLLTESACGMIPYPRKNLVASLWCEPGPSAFVCGHVVFVDVETGQPEWSTPPPKAVAVATTMLMRPDGGLLIFSAGPRGNPEDRARMWSVHPDGRGTSESIVLPWHGVWAASLGNDGIIYAVTSDGLAAITEAGQVLWRYEPEDAVGSFSGAPAIGANGCVYFEVVKQRNRFDFEREVVCLRSSATGLAESAWPRSLGGNHSGMRSP